MSVVDGFKDCGGLKPPDVSCRCGCGKAPVIRGYASGCRSRVRRQRIAATGARITEDQKTEMRRLRGRFWTDETIARHLGISTATVRRYTRGES